MYLLFRIPKGSLPQVGYLALRTFEDLYSCFFPSVFFKESQGTSKVPRLIDILYQYVDQERLSV